MAPLRRILRWLDALDRWFGFGPTRPSFAQTMYALAAAQREVQAAYDEVARAQLRLEEARRPIAIGYSFGAGRNLVFTGTIRDRRPWWKRR